MNGRRVMHGNQPVAPSPARAGTLARSPPARQGMGMVGNQALQRASAAGALHAKLPVSQSDDPAELEAERIAEQVMRLPASEPPARASCTDCGDAAAPCPSCASRVPTVRRQMRGHDAPQHTSTVDQLGLALGPGRPLDAGARAFFEPRFDSDFSNVVVHTGPTAAASAESINALAFTVGNHVAFAEQQYSPDTGNGRHLLAHELVHTLQGAGTAATVHRSLARTDPIALGERPVNETAPPPLPAPSRAAVAMSPEMCPPPAELDCAVRPDSPTFVTTTLLFPVDSAALSASQLGEIDLEAAAWYAAGGTSLLRVDGYASAEGPCAYNWDLSCRRAQAVAARLRTLVDIPMGTGSNVETFAHGESDAAGAALPPNRRATIVRLAPPAPPAPPPAEPDPTPSCTFPALLGSARGCGSGADFLNFDFPSIATRSAVALNAWAFSYGRVSRDWVSDLECELEMDGVLTALAGTAGHRAARRFFAGSGGTVTHGATSTLGAMALASPSFLATVSTVQSAIEVGLAAQAVGGALDVCALSVTPPETHFEFGDGWALKAVIGGTQGEELFVTAFSGDPTLRTYSIDLEFRICDDFGVDESDLYAPGLMPFWVLQHERSASAYVPFINQLELPVTVSGTF